MLYVPPEQRAEAPPATASSRRYVGSPPPPMATVRLPEQAIEPIQIIEPITAKAQEVFKPERDELGRILPGQPAMHPAGRPSISDADRRYRARAKELMRRYSADQLHELIVSGGIGKFPIWDAIILRNIAAAYTKGGNELKILLDRVEGSVRATDEEKDPVGGNTYNQTVVIKRYVGALPFTPAK